MAEASRSARDPRDLATALFGPDPDELPGTWTRDGCGTFPSCPRCPNCLGFGQWRFEPRPAPSTAGGRS